MNYKNCSNCRHSSSSSVPENVEVVFDENISISDETVPFYTCRVIDEKPVEIGLSPIFCHHHSYDTDNVKDEIVSNADKMIAKFEERMKKRESEERDG